MSITEHTDVIAEMDRVRSRGTQQAQKVGKDIERAGDWREYVKVHPLPSILVAAAVGYLLVPQKRARVVKTAIPPIANPVAGPGNSDSSVKNLSGNVLSSFLGSWMGGLVTSSVKRIAAHQVSAFLESLNDDRNSKSHRSRPSNPAGR